MIAVDDENRQNNNRMDAGIFDRFTRRYGWLLVTAWLFVIVLLTRYLPLVIRSVNLNIYLVQPLLWLSIAALVLKLLEMKPRELWDQTDRWHIKIAVLVGLFQVSMLVISGLLVGFGNSPYSHKLWLIALNIWYVTSRLVGMELARWFLLKAFKPRNQMLGIGLAWLCLTVANLPLTRFGSSSLENLEGVFRLVGNAVLPAASTNVLATYLAVSGGPLVSLAYVGMLAAFEWLSPILPNMEWTLNAFIGTVVPILAVLFVHDILEWRAAQSEEPDAKSSSIGTGWVLVSVVVVFMVWFNSGLFGVRPTLISGISMEPTIKPGDIVITREVTASEIKLGDVVLFSDGTRSILHRVVEIQMEDGDQIFFTQGDNVAKRDEPWHAHQLKGKLVMVIPKLGWVSFGMKNLISRFF